MLMKKRLLMSMTFAVFITILTANVSSALTFGPAVNLGSPVNTASIDRFPDISDNDLSLYFSSNSGDNEDIWLSTRASTSDPFGAPTDAGILTNVNLSTAIDRAPSISKDRDALYFHSNRGAGGDDDIWLSTRTTTADNFNTPINDDVLANVNTAANEFAADISDDGLTLFFASDRSGGSGSGDLYMATRPNTASSFAAPSNLGVTVNSSGNDVGPSISKDGLRLYFASNGLGGEGGFDLFVTTRSTGTSTDFDAPVNLGALINSNSGDFAPSISSDDSTLYFSSGRAVPTGGSIDIYQSTAIPEPTTIALLGIGLAGLGGRYWRRHKKKAIGSRQ